MVKIVKLLAAVSLLGLVTYFGWRTYQYFFNATMPRVELIGLQNNQWCSGDVVVTLKGDHPYGIESFSVWLDEKPLVNDFLVKDRRFQHPLTIPVQNIQDGQHTLVVEAIDRTYSHKKATMSRNFTTDNVPLQVAFVQPESAYKVFQGRCLHVQFQSNKSLEEVAVKTLSKVFPAYPEQKNSLIYEAFIPVDCETQPSEYLFTIEGKDKVGNVCVLENKFQVVAFPFKKKVLHVQNTHVEKEMEATQLTEHDLESSLAQLAQDSVAEKLWHGVFYVPLHMTGMTTEFGIIRTSQHKGRYMHKAVDLIAGHPKAVIWAAHHGKVVLKERYQHSGNTVVLDHGHGVLTMYYHLDSFAPGLEVGQTVKKGKPLGKMGKTGYANGNHLHWELRVQNIPVDPMQWTKKDF